MQHLHLLFLTISWLSGFHIQGLQLLGHVSYWLCVASVLPVALQL